MKVTGSATLNAPVPAVWAALNDPAVLVRTIPGCQQLEQTGPDTYRMTIRAGVAAIKGVYLGTVALREQQPPESFVLAANGAGGPGTVDARVTVRLTDAGGTTRLDYDADAIVGGTIGGVGQRVLSGVARRTANEFFAEVDRVLTAPPEPAAATAAAATAGMPGAAAAPTGGPDAGQGPGLDSGQVISGFWRAPGAGIGIGAGTEPWALTAAAGVGGVIALTGVGLGWLLGRRGRP